MLSHKDAFVAPADATNYNEIQGHIARLGGNVDTFRECCRLLNVPGHLYYFGWVSNKITTLYNHKKQYLDSLTGKTRADKKKIYAALAVLESWITFYQEHAAELDLAMGETFARGPETSVHPLKKKGMKRHGLYAALLCVPETQITQTVWEPLCFRFIVVHAIAMTDIAQEVYEKHHGTDEISLPSRCLYTPAKHLRYLTESHYSDVLTFVNDRVWLADSLDEVLSLAQGGTALRRLLKAMAAIECNATTHFPGTTPRKTQNDYYLYGQGHVDIDERVRTIDFYDEAEANQTMIEIDHMDEEWLAANSSHIDIAPGEMGDGHLLSLTQHVEGLTHQSLMQSRNRQRYQITHAQMLPWQRSQLSFHQVLFVHTRLTAIIAQNESRIARSAADQLRYETALILLTSLWTGSQLARAAQITHHHRRVEDSERLLGYFDHGEKEHHENENEQWVRYEWRFRALAPVYLTDPHFDTTLFRHRFKSFWLPDLIKVVPHLIRYRGQCDTKRKQSLFHRRTEDYKKSAKKVIESWQNELAGEGITLRKIELFLFQHIAAETNDITSAAYITGQQHRLANTTMFYSSPQISTLREVYVASMTPLASLLAGSVDKIESTTDSGTVGARHCLNFDGCHEAIEKVITAIPSAQHHCWSEQVHYHNHLTFCLFLLFSYSTAARAIQNPFIFPSEFNEAGFAAYTDKDTIPPYHARLLWLPSWVLETLRLYEGLRKQIAFWVTMRAPDKTNDALKEPAFFITGQNKNHVVNVTPKHLRPFFSQYMNVPTNAHRRFLRTALLENGMNIEHINAFLGHWSRGEEPWSVHSSFSVSAYVTALETHLDPLLKKLGFDVLHQHLRDVFKPDHVYAP